ncbi:glycosyltransferase [Massilia sp. BJB1822]|uniref:glycosyltransferase n=1 Tax=Massilia sp. BJB1822 TaxID=2744470 RepID=UPI001594138B|nr:glycosyltransferase [Massilia sp. BJB1822]NVE00001.1 glycosyltransferase [Massilia sp. BJB1822]
MNQADGACGRRLHLLQLVPEALPSFRADVTALFGKYLPRHGVHCHVVGSASPASLSEQGFASVRRPAYAAARWRRELGFWGLCLRSLFGARRAQCDVIQVRDMVTLGLCGLLAARLKGVPFVYWMSFLMSEARIERARARLAAGGGLRDRLVLAKGLIEQALLHKVLLARADHVFVQSEAMLELLQRQGVPRARMSAVPMGVDMEALAARPQPRRLPGWETGPLLAYLGTLDRLRDLGRVIDALALVRQRFPAARLLLIGDAPNRADVEQLLTHARSLDLAEAVHVTGWLPGPEAWQLLAGADAAVSYFPRSALLDTNSPTKLLEYLALALPSLGNDNPDQKTVLSESGAGWLTGSTAAELAEAACAIFADAAGAARRAAAGPAYIEAQRSYRVLGERTARRYFDLVR